VVTDDSDRQLLPSTFESMLGLPHGFLEAERVANASMSWTGTELIRQLNEHALEQGWPQAAYIELLRSGVVRGLGRAPKSAVDQPIPPLPGWAREAVEEVGRRRLETIERLGIHVIGDPQCLLPPSDMSTSATLVEPEVIAISTAAETLAGVINRAQQIERKLSRREERTRQRLEKRLRAQAGRPQQAVLGEVPFRNLAREVVRRPARRLRAALTRSARRGR
jgi:hypothetical protein